MTGSDSLGDLERLTPLRMEVREFLTQCLADGVFTPSLDGWMSGVSKSFSRLLADRGWVGMTIPKEYGGGGRSYLERFVVAEELLAAGAPVAAHWVNERQFAPQLLRIGTEEQRRRFLPAIARAEVMFSIGLSEPDSGTDLASVRTRAVRRRRWVAAQRAEDLEHQRAPRRLHGGAVSNQRRRGSSRRSQPTARSARGRGRRGASDRRHDGEADFCEVFFSDVHVPDGDVIGEVGEGWRQALAGARYHERSGPDRYMSTFPLLERFAATADLSDRQSAATLGQLIAEIVALRSLSIGVVQASEAGIRFGVDAALAKDVGTTFERTASSSSERPGRIRRGIASLPRRRTSGVTRVHLRGGTNEILRTITARKLLGW